MSGRQNGVCRALSACVCPEVSMLKQMWKPRHGETERHSWWRAGPGFVCLQRQHLQRQAGAHRSRGRHPRCCFFRRGNVPDTTPSFLESSPPCVVTKLASHLPYSVHFLGKTMETPGRLPQPPAAHTASSSGPQRADSCAALDL